MFVMDALEVKSVLYGDLLLSQRPHLFTRTLSEPPCYASVKLAAGCTMSEIQPRAAAMAREVFLKYLAPEAVMEINVSSAVREQCTRMFEKDLIGMFDPAQVMAVWAVEAYSSLDDKSR